MYVTLLLNFNAPPIPKVNHCVVVGNGQASIAQGHLIDQHDAVIRMNDAPTVGFEKYVGSKTTHRLVLNEHIGLEKVMRVDKRASNPYDTEEQFIYLVRDESDLAWLYTLAHRDTAERMSVRGHKNFYFVTHLTDDIILDNIAMGKLFTHGNQSMRLMHSDAWSDVQSWLELNGNHTPSTGMMAIFMALHFCSSVKITGFEATLSGGGSYRRYYGSDGLEGQHGVSAWYAKWKTSTGQDLMRWHSLAHDVTQESRLLKSLLLQKRVHLLAEDTSME